VRCPDGAVLAAWVDDEVAGLPAAAVADHVAGCARCARAARAERQVKLRTLSLRTEVSATHPDPALLSVLMTVPQAEHDRALRRAHRASCGNGPHGAGGGRLRMAAMGAGAAVWLLAAVWSSPPGTSSTSAPELPSDMAVASPAPAVAAGLLPLDVTAALAPPAPLQHTLLLADSAVFAAPAVPTGDLFRPARAPVPVVPGR